MKWILLYLISVKLTDMHGCQAGAAAAFTVDVMVYPLDTLKTRQQSQDFLKTFADPSAKTRIPSRDLFKGLYQGIGIVIVATLPAAGTFFTTYEAAKSFIGRHGSAISLPQPMVHSAASAVAECASCLVLTPAEVIKQNAQMIQRRSVDNGHSPGGSTSLEALRQLTGTGVSRRLLSGYTALVARNLPFTAIQFPIFELMRARIWSYRHHRRRRRRRPGEEEEDQGSLLETGVVTGTSAGLAGSLSAIVTTPMDVVKTRMMLLPSSDRRDVGQDSRDRSRNYRSRSGLAVAREVIAERGIVGLFRGSTIRAVWTAVGSGLYLGMYEVSKVWLSGGEDKNADVFNS